MPNGKYQLDCCYCENWRGEYSGSDGIYDQGFCKLFNVKIPSTGTDSTHRICVDFAANEELETHISSVRGPTIDERLERFGGRLKPGILYGFAYNTPVDVHVLKHLTSESVDESEGA